MSPGPATFAITNLTGEHMPELHAAAEVSALQLLSAQLVFVAVFALVVAAMLARQASRDVWQARALRDEARALLAGRDES